MSTSAGARAPVGARVRTRLHGRFVAFVERVTDPLHAWPLRWRLITILVVLVFTSLLATNTVTSALLRNYLLDRTRVELATAAAPAAYEAGRELRYQTDTALPSNYAVLFMLRDGTVREVPAVDERYHPDLPFLTDSDPAVTTGEPFIVGSTIGEARWMVVAGRLDDNQGTYAVAASLSGVEETVAQVRVLTTVIGLVVLAACALLGWFGISRAFRPLRTIEDTAAGIAGGDLTRRIPEFAAGDEVASLSASLNAMLSQVETSFAVREASEDRMRRFVTDASHELRTPLATIRGYAELYRQGAAATPEDTASAMRRIELEATRMSDLVEDLLTLARLDNRRPMALGDVDLTVLASDAVQDARARDPQRPLRLLGLDGAPIRPALVPGDEDRLRQVVTNLLANALQHTPPGTPVEVEVGLGAGETVRFVVRDHGTGIDPALAGKVFERFYRLDPARGREGRSSTGLGLAIVAAIVDAHEGRVGVAPTPGGGASFVVDLPRADLPADDADDPEDNDDPDDPELSEGPEEPEEPDESGGTDASNGPSDSDGPAGREHPGDPAFHSRHPAGIEPASQQSWSTGTNLTPGAQQ